MLRNEENKKMKTLFDNAFGVCLKIGVSLLFLVTVIGLFALWGDLSYTSARRSVLEELKMLREELEQERHDNRRIETFQEPSSSSPEKIMIIKALPLIQSMKDIFPELPKPLPLQQKQPSFPVFLPRQSFPPPEYESNREARMSNRFEEIPLLNEIERPFYHHHPHQQPPPPALPLRPIPRSMSRPIPIPPMPENNPVQFTFRGPKTPYERDQVFISPLDIVNWIGRPLDNEEMQEEENGGNMISELLPPAEYRESFRPEWEEKEVIHYSPYQEEQEKPGFYVSDVDLIMNESANPSVVRVEAPAADDLDELSAPKVVRENETYEIPVGSSLKFGDEGGRIYTAETTDNNPFSLQIIEGEEERRDDNVSVAPNYVTLYRDEQTYEPTQNESASDEFDQNRPEEYYFKEMKPISDNYREILQPTRGVVRL